MQEKFEIITNHKLQFWTKLPKNGQCAPKEKVLRVEIWHLFFEYWSQSEKPSEIKLPLKLCLVFFQIFFPPYFCYSSN